MNRLFANKITLVGLGILIFGVITVIALQDDSTSSDNQVDPRVDLTLNEIDHVKGNRDAGVVLMEFGDFQCPACASHYPMIKQLAAEYGDRMAVVYRHFPLTSIHANAFDAAKAAEAAGKQGKFWEMHDLLFERQVNWSNISNPDNTFVAYAGELSLDQEKFIQDYKSDEVDFRVRSDYEGAVNLGFNSTPTFVLNGELVSNPRNYDEWKQLIDQVLAGS